MSLITKLDGAYKRNPTPDGVVHQLAARGWITCGEITEKFFHQYKETPFVIGHPESPSWIGGVDPEYPWYFTHCAADYRTFISCIPNHLMIPLSDYDPEEVPWRTSLKD